jgi:monofunctional biosynthetic peptidoglycan transglycosylase
MFSHGLFWQRRRGKRGFRESLRRSARAMRWIFRFLLLFLVVDLFYLVITWPDWNKLADGPVPKSAFMVAYEKQQVREKNWPRLNWQPVSFNSIPKHLIRAVILAEDSRFYEHSGFDLIAFKEAMDYNLSEGRFVLGASTISQQTVKNLFLSPSRNPLRKWHELILTWGMERSLSKPRILELYLNIAQFGQGIYGVQAAAKVYWGIAPDRLTVTQASELAATLPSPVKNNPVTRGRFFEKRSKRLLSLLIRFPGDAAETVRARPFEMFALPPENGNGMIEPSDYSSTPPLVEELPPPPREAAPVESGGNSPPVDERSIRNYWR